MLILIVSIASIVIWGAVTQELEKSSKDCNKRKIITLMSAGTLSTLILTIKLFQAIPFS